MQRIRISVKGALTGSVLYAALRSLIQFRSRVRALVLEEFPGEPSWKKIDELASIYRDIDEIYHWERSSRDEIVAKFGDDAEATLQRMRESREYFSSPQTSFKRFRLIVMCAALNDHFRAARATEPVDWDRAERILNDPTIPRFDREREPIEDWLFAVQMDAEELLHLTYRHSEELGEIEGMRLQALSVARAGGAGRARKLKPMEEQARAHIRRYVDKHFHEATSADPKSPRNRARRLSASSIATAMIHGEMSEFGYRRLADLASEELDARKAKQSVQGA